MVEVSVALKGIWLPASSNSTGFSKRGGIAVRIQISTHILAALLLVSVGTQGAAHASIRKIDTDMCRIHRGLGYRA